jgi:hypothetical protein
VTEAEVDAGAARVALCEHEEGFISCLAAAALATLPVPVNVEEDCSQNALPHCDMSSNGRGSLFKFCLSYHPPQAVPCKKQLQKWSILKTAAVLQKE